MIVTATQIKITSVSGLLRFIFSVRSIKQQLTDNGGIVFMKFKGQRTLSGWLSLEDMKSFRNSGAHLEAMKNLGRIGSAKSITWETETEPTWEEAKILLQGVRFRGTKPS